MECQRHTLSHSTLAPHAQKRRQMAASDPSSARPAARAKCAVVAGRPGRYAADSGCFLFRIWPECHPIRLVRGAADTLRPVNPVEQKKKNKETSASTRTFEVEMGGPVSFNMRNHPFSTAVQTWIILDADARARGVQVVESRGQWREGSSLDTGASSLLLPRRGVEGCI